MSHMRCDYLPEAKRLRKSGRIAVWNRHKIVVVMSMGIWLTDIGCLIHGKYLLQITGESVCEPGDITGISGVNFQFRLFWIS